MAKHQRAYKWTKEEVLERVKGSFGVLTVIQKKLGINRDTLRKYRKRWHEVDEAIKEERGYFMGLAESRLVKQVEAGNLEAIKYVLSHLGKDDGWGDEQTVNLNGEGIIQPIIVFGDAKDKGDAQE